MTTDPSSSCDPVVVRALMAVITQRGFVDADGSAAVYRALVGERVTTLADLRALLASGRIRPSTATLLLSHLPPQDDPPFGVARRLIRLAEGGMGQVWLAAIADELCVVKVLHQRLSDATALRRFLREVEITASLNHPNIIRYLGHGVVEGERPFLILEYLSGGDVGSLLRQVGTISEADALAIAAQALRGLRGAWARGVVHRDIKPSNVFITAQGVVRVADFGLARSVVVDLADPVTAHGTIIGSPSYMSPEQVRTCELDWRADVYALGCTLYALLCGDPPFTGPAATILFNHLNRSPVDVRLRRSGLHAETWALLERCLAKQPGGRFSEPTELTLFLDAALDASGVDQRASLSHATVSWSSSRASLTAPVRSLLADSAARRAVVAMPEDHSGTAFHHDPQEPTLSSRDLIEDSTCTHADLPPVGENQAAIATVLSGSVPRVAAFAGPWSGAIESLSLTIDSAAGGRLILVAGKRLVCGKVATAPVNCILRDYPESAMVQSCGRVSRQHLALTIDGARVEVSDCGSTNGTLFDGQLLKSGATAEWSDLHEHLLAIPSSVALTARLIPRRGPPVTAIEGAPVSVSGGLAAADAIDAVVLRRPTNRPTLAYALVHRACTIGPVQADLPLAGWPDNRALTIARWGDRWIARYVEWDWCPLPSLLPAGITMGLGGRWD